MGEKRVPYTGVRKYIGDAMLKSVTTYPQARSYIECDMTEVVNLCEEMKNNNQKVSLSAIVVKIVGKALEAHPRLNCRMEGNEIVYYDEINCGFGMDIGKGLYVLTLRDVNKKSLQEIHADIKGYIKKMQDGTLTLDDMQGSTFTLNNFAGRRSEYFESIITNDQAIIVGVAGIKKMPVVNEKDEIQIRSVAKVILNMNHSLCDGGWIHDFADTIYEICLEPKKYLL